MVKIVRTQEGFHFVDLTNGEREMIKQMHQHRIKVKCKICSRPLFRMYGYILHKLERAGLLKKRTKRVCCECWERYYEDR